MRDKLQAFCDLLKQEVSDEARYGSQQVAGLMAEVIRELESILATEPPAVTVQPGWYCKDSFGLWRFMAEPTFDGSWTGVRRIRIREGMITDPWSESHPNGGPECLLEVK